MIDVVKFTWSNPYGYWIPAAWVLVSSSADDAAVLSRARLGRPGMVDLRVLSRETMPEALRMEGRSRSLLSKVVLFDKQADSYSAAEMIDAMVAVTA